MLRGHKSDRKEDEPLLLNKSKSKSTSCCCTVRGACIAFAILGVLFLVIGLVSNTAITFLMTKQIKDDIPLGSADSQIYDVWQDTKSTPMYTVFHIFNITNPNDVIHKKAIPKVNILGPYTYQERRRKYGIEWSEDKAQVKYYYDRDFHIIDEKCNGRQIQEPDFFCTEDDSLMLTSFNVPLLGVLEMARSIGIPIATKILQILETRKKEELLVTKSVRELIFGYEDPVLKELSQLVTYLDPYYTLQVNASKGEMSKYSVVYTGSDDYKLTGQYIQWQGQPSLQNATFNGPLWASGCDGTAYQAQANMINGTEGITFHPLIERDEVLQVFTEDLLRASDIVQVGDSSFKGIDLYRYGLAPYASQNVTEYPPACGFNSFGPTGVLNMTDFETAPIFATKPYFLDTDESYYRRIDLPTPNRTLHDTFLDIEPWTGSVMRAHQRVQINVHVRPVDNKFTVDVEPLGYFFPLITADEQGFIPDDLANQWKGQVGLALKAGTYGQIIGISLGSLLLFLAVILFVILRIRKGRRAAVNMDTVQSQE